MYSIFIPTLYPNFDSKEKNQNLATHHPSSQQVVAAAQNTFDNTNY